MKQIPRVKIELTKGDVEVLKSGKIISPTKKLEFNEKGQVDLRYCIVQISWSDDI